ncbi:GntR family transcriptional regulator [Sinomonas terrae]|uniref:GntR family transcriptional regulator n=1 Tax=Sinomonas terrae TaxID=2908838 RepID=A0ABS9U0G0_9MICC|nr:GntR family transcriptional regulator [Sinomonas terrae]MCH6470173.1 GntR family transcriptional regulator [Sinomonas terrae]
MNRRTVQTSSRPIRRSGLRESVYESILEMLVEGEIAEGSPLRVEALAQLLEVSPTPVREALVQLEATGLVTYVANRGYTAAPHLSADEKTAMMDARLVLEVAAVRRAAELGDPSVPSHLRALLAGQREAASRLDGPDGEQQRDALRDYLRIDHSFHDGILHGCGNHFLFRLASTLDAQAQRMRQSFLNGIPDAEDVLAEHSAIADAIASGDPDAAEQAMRDHLSRVLSLSLSQAD